MKKIILLSIVSILAFSCSKTEQYYGTWSQINGLYPYIKINTDSISLSDDGSIWKSYPVEIKNNSLTFLNHTFPTTIYKDSLIFQKLTYEKDTILPILEITLPKFTNYRLFEPSRETAFIYVRFGKVPNSNEFKLQLNDKYAKPEELIDFVFSHDDVSFHHALRRIAFICDNDTKMRDLEALFFEMIKINAIVFFAVNDVTYNIIEDRIERGYDLYRQYITPIRNIHYEAKIGSKVPVQYNNFYPSIDYFEPAKSQFLFLIHNEFYIGKEKYSVDTFSKKLDELITENKQFVCLYDLDSDFKHNTIFNNILNEAYQKQYDSIALEKFSKTYKLLNYKEKETVRELYPRRSIQNISIPHFISFEETPMEDFNFPFKNIKEQLPKAYFKK
ncbi:hypothetical protein C8N46_106221 [Kordia periserrulae]|uniref:Lipoprotein n=1 Tax=Kordia periserrulae TaxID=701523 RepID=A0A2T6BWW8_9FLAO|nr:hypothetical protein [Kordia periserrulae]PTX60575.1 hypothetical protein C8N46_106221 [Kordia periserrulae]